MINVLTYLYEENINYLLEPRRCIIQKTYYCVSCSSTLTDSTEKIKAYIYAVQKMDIYFNAIFCLNLFTPYCTVGHMRFFV